MNIESKQEDKQQPVGIFFTFSINDTSLETLCANVLRGDDGILEKENMATYFCGNFFME